MASPTNVSSPKVLANPAPSPPTKLWKEGPGTGASSLSSWNKATSSPKSDAPIRYLKGVGPRIAELLEQKGIRTPEELLEFFPYKYLDRTRLDSIATLTTGPNKTVAGKILAAGMSNAYRRRIFEVALGDETGVISLKWFRFNMRQMMGGFKKGMGLLASGHVTEFRNKRQLIHPQVQFLDGETIDEIQAPGIVPVYSQIPGLGARTLRKILREALNALQDRLTESIPPEILARYRFPPKREALEAIHFPSPEEKVVDLEDLNAAKSPAHRRAVFEEFFLMELGLALKRKKSQREEGVVCPGSATLSEWIEALPFRLTSAQERALREILADLAAPYPMNRLLQGDVGSGKTVVALLAARVAITNGYQAAIMAPTEILAEQHFLTARALLAGSGLPIALLTSSLSAPEKKKVAMRLRTGEIPLVIGTHALLAEKVEFHKLGLAVIDEQHRFGVLQRANLKAKGKEKEPNILVMTATPIPRTLSMTLYGDLDLSVIDELPPGREPVKTILLPGKERRLLYQTIGEVLEKGGQGYIVYPLIEESEKLPLKDATRMAAELQKVFLGLSIALLHGKVEEAEKNRVMKEFKEGKIKLLVSTTVIEVGIDVPNASLMVIEHADRFGLSQLHQLRGRVGRGRGLRPSFCFLVTSAAKSDLAFRRLQVMVESHDGFRIAEQDLAIRGPGEFMGTRQSGLPDLQIANLLRDHAVLKAAREEAFSLVEKDPQLRSVPLLKETLLRKWRERLALADVG